MLKIILKNSSFSSNKTHFTPPPPPQHTSNPLIRRLVLLSSLFLLLFFLFFFTSCQCGVETTDEGKTLPKITSTFPQHNAVEVPFSASFQIVIDFDKDIKINQKSNPKLTLTATSGTNEDDYLFTHEDTRLSTQGKKLTLQMTNLLLKSTEYTFTLPKNAVVNDSDEGNEEYTLTFTTASKITIDKSLLSISSSKWYETKSSDNGSFGATITITYPTGVSNNESLSGFFDTDLSDQGGDATSPVTISGLPDGLVLRMKKQPNRVELSLRGNATTHQKTVDNTSLNLILLEDLFTISDDYVFSADILLSFDIIFGTAYWSARYGHQAFAYDGKLWVLGGFDDNILNNNIWTSEDSGKNWSKVAVNGPQWSERCYHQSFVYDDKIWVIGGFTGANQNDIWNSADKGANWSKIVVNDSHWSVRYGHQSFAYDDKIWVLGGGDNQIWYSADKGTNWSQVAVSGSHWAGRYYFEAFGYDDKLWVLGGSTHVNGNSQKDDIWYSTNGGTNWSEVVVNDTHWSARAGLQSFAHDDKLWVLGGRETGGLKKRDIWNSSDGGTNWETVPIMGTELLELEFFQAFADDDKIWVLGGIGRNDKLQDYIWYTDTSDFVGRRVEAFY